jgi:hypothetical protein
MIQQNCAVPGAGQGPGSRPGPAPDAGEASAVVDDVSQETVSLQLAVWGQAL